MKHNFTCALTVLCLVSVFNSYEASSQTNSPNLVFKSPVLFSGKAGEKNTVYKFSNVMAGVNALVKIIDLKNGAVLINIDDSSTGYMNAWQPTIGGPGTPVGNRSYIEWEVKFVNASGDLYVLPLMDMSAVDIDGDGVKISEFVESKNHLSYDLPVATTLLKMWNEDSDSEGDDDYQNSSNAYLVADGPLVNRLNIDTVSLDVRVNYHFVNKSTVYFKIGSFVNNNKTTAAASLNRYNSLYFKKISNIITLPVNYTSFTGQVVDKNVMCSWVTELEINNNHFEIEHSTNAKNFTVAGLILDAEKTNGTVKSYRFKENAAQFGNASTIFYRLKEVDNNGELHYSATIVVKLSTTVYAETVRVSPNPFTDKLAFSFEGSNASTVEIRILSLAGKKIVSRQYNAAKGLNNLQISDLGKLPSGMYIAQVLTNGVAIGYQKIIK